jgi:hypothetical protein
MLKNKVREDPDEARAAQSSTHKESVLLRAKALGTNLPTLSGAEDVTTRELTLAHRAMRESKMVSLRPLLPLLLRLKGKPYRLHNYFPFEPFFRTRVPKTVVLKTGRQVSKCLPVDEMVLTLSGWKRAGDVCVGERIISLHNGGFVTAVVTEVWNSGEKECCLVRFADGQVRATPDHKFLVRDADNHTEEYRELKHVHPGDYVASRSPRNVLYWARVRSVEPIGPAACCDLEVAATSNFVAGGRVVHNSTSLAAQGIVFSNSVPYFSTLYVTPLFEMIRRFSHNYVRKFIEDSPVKKLLTSAATINSVLQRTFLNGAAMYFSYAFLDAERTRGIPADKNVIDEVQDMNFDFLQIIHETMSGSPYGLRQYAGTPKSLDNTMQKLWQDSSQAEWMIRCQRGGCNEWNIPSLDYDLMEMIGPYRDDISETNPGVICAHCTKPLDPRTGRWVHRFPERRWTFAGYHVPQVIMPMHYGDKDKWGELVGKQQGRGSTTPTTFANEICGESCDEGSKIITLSELKAACILPWRRRAEQARKKIKQYPHRIVSIDWGGGGGKLKGASAKGGDQKRERTSFTTYAVLGMLPDGKIDTIWGHRSVRTHNWEYEAQLAIETFEMFKCSDLVHDYSNAGEGRLLFLYQGGLPANRIVNIRYHGFGHAIMTHHPATEDNPNEWYSVDKSRSLVTTCMCIKHGLLRFFEYDYQSADQPGLVEDFLALVEEKIETRLGSDTYTITRNPHRSDDFAQSVNMGACALWWKTDRWPRIAEAAKFKISKKQMEHIHPSLKVDWDDI